MIATLNWWRAVFFNSLFWYSSHFIFCRQSVKKVKMWFNYIQSVEDEGDAEGIRSNSLSYISPAEKHLNIWARMILCKKSQTSGVKSVLEWIYDSSGSCSGECLASYKVEPGVILQQLHRIQPLRSFISLTSEKINQRSCLWDFTPIMLKTQMWNTLMVF